MSQYFQPLVEIELEILLGRGANEATTPATPLQVRYWTADRAPRAEEEDIDIRIDLADDREAHIEVQVECLERYVGPQAAVLPLVTKQIWYQRSVTALLHQDDWVQGAWYGG